MSSKQLAPFVSLGAIALEERQKDDFYATKGSAMCYARFIWKKGNHIEAPRIYWI